jgi:DivIVA domain-containing protein
MGGGTVFLVWLSVVAALVALVVLLTLGRGGSLPDAVPDDVEVDLPDDRPLSADEVAVVRLPMALRGYRMRPVDDLLDRLTDELAARDARIRELESRLARAPLGDPGPGAAT